MCWMPDLGMEARQARLEFQRVLVRGAGKAVGPKNLVVEPA